jgi:hypothetical protein
VIKVNISLHIIIFTFYFVHVFFFLIDLSIGEFLVFFF